MFCLRKFTNKKVPSSSKEWECQFTHLNTEINIWIVGLCSQVISVMEFDLQIKLSLAWKINKNTPTLSLPYITITNCTLHAIYFTKVRPCLCPKDIPDSLCNLRTHYYCREEGKINMDQGGKKNPFTPSLTLTGRVKSIHKFMVQQKAHVLAWQRLTWHLDWCSMLHLGSLMHSKQFDQSTIKYQKLFNTLTCSAVLAS